MKPTLIATLGLPGSGKSYFAERLAKDLHFAHLRSDEIRLQINPKPTYTNEEHKVVFGLMDFLTLKLLSTGVSVIYDANVNKHIHRQNLRGIAGEQDAKFVLIYIDTPLEIAIKRAKTREFHPIDQDVVESLHKEMEYMPEEEKVTINGLESYEKQRDDIVKQITAE